MGNSRRKCIYKDENYYFHRTALFAFKHERLDKYHNTTLAIIEHVVTGKVEKVEVDELIFVPYNGH